MTARMRAALGVVIILAAGAAGVLTWRFTSHHPLRPASAQAAATTSANAGSPAAAQDEAARAARQTIPQRLPAIALPDRHGVMRHLSDWHGHPLLINFWAPWCAPCRREIPLLKRLQARDRAQGLRIIGIGVDQRAAVLKYASKAGISYPVLIADSDGMKTVDAFGMQTVFPFSVFADKSGRIITIKVGELHPREAAFIIGQLRRIDAGTLDVTRARHQIAARIRALAIQRAKAQGAPTPASAT